MEKKSTRTRERQPRKVKKEKNINSVHATRTLESMGQGYHSITGGIFRGKGTTKEERTEESLSEV